MTQIEKIVNTYREIKKDIAKQHNLTDEIKITELADKEMEKISLMLESTNKPYFYDDRVFYIHCIHILTTELDKIHKGQILLDIDVYKLLNKQLDFWESRLQLYKDSKSYD